MRPLQLRLLALWDFRDDHAKISWTADCKRDLLWWSEAVQTAKGRSLHLPVPDLSFYSDASDIGWGALIGDHQASGRWNQQEISLSINMREMLAVQLGLREFQHILQGKTVALFCDNVTTVAYLRKQGGTVSRQLFLKAREIIVWTENHQVVLLPQFIAGSSNSSADLLSRPNQVIGSEWILHQQVVNRLLRRWPAIIDLFATSLTARLPVYFSPSSDPMSAGTGPPTILGQSPGLRLSTHSNHPEGSGQTKGLGELSTNPDCPVLAPEGLVPRPTRDVV